MLNYDLSRMQHKAEFGTTKSYDADNFNGYVEYYVPEFSVWAGEYTNTQSQTYSNLGTDINVDLVLAIRHNPKVNDNKLLVCYQGVIYKIMNINSDNRLNAFDLITLEKDKSHIKHIPEDTSKLGQPRF